MGAHRAFPRLPRIWADHGSTGSLIPWTAPAQGVCQEGVYPPFGHLRHYAPDLAADLGGEPGFHVVPKRGIVARTCSWIGRQRRLRNDDERQTGSAEPFISLVGIRLLLARLARG